ncbi:MAG TPA: hypothetical protein VGT98_11955, partial [Candidatus Elarobacter sp.]|nr:hypothetical protein [Candidatus Elarobacter sp.]
ARLLAIAGIRGEGAGTVIVGRAFHEVAPETGRRRPHARDAAIALTVMIVASIIAFLVLRAMFSAA